MNRNEHALAIARAATEIYSKTSGGLGHGEILNILDRELGWQTLRSPSTEEARPTAEQMFTLELQAENARLKKDRDEWRALWGIGGSAAIGTLKKRAERLEAENAKLREEKDKLERAKYGTPCKCESWMDACQKAEDRAETAERQLSEAQEALRKIGERAETALLVHRNMDALLEIKRIAAIGKEGQ